MPRIPQDELDRLKADIDLVALIRAKGVELKPHGSADLIGRCPFHDDKTPSLVVTPSKGLWHCLGACQKGGDVVSWVMRADGVSFRHAVGLLKDGKAGALLASDKLVKVATVPRLPPPVSLDVDDQTLLNQVTDYYHKTLLEDPLAASAREYLKKRGLDGGEAIRTFKLGYSGRTLGLRLPDKNREAGAAIRARLEALGVFRATSGHEHLAGSLVVPILDARGNTQGLYGRKVTENLRPGTARHLYLPGPHRGIFNPAALNQKEVILCEALLDALSFWVHGFRNVTASYGVEGFTEEMLSAFIGHGVRRVYIAYDRDEAGDHAAAKLADALMAEGLEVLRVQFPHGMDANDYVRKVAPADKALQVLIHGARWLGKGPRPTEAKPREAPEPPIPSLSNGEHVDMETGEVLTAATELASSLAASAAEAVAPASSKEDAAREAVRRHYPHLREETVALVTRLWLLRRERLGEDTPIPGAEVVESPEATDEASASEAAVPPAATGTAATGSAASLPHAFHGEDVAVTLGDRAYRVRGLAKNLTHEVLKVNLRAVVGERYYLDTLDFYNAKARESFVAHAALELEVKADVLKRDLGRLLQLLERLQEERITAATKPKEKAAYALTATEQAEALAYLRAPDLASRIVTDMTACGYVGEETNKLVGYLAAVSRKLDDPLSVIIQSSSASGKSSLMDAILSLVPPEDKMEFSALTGQALFYMEKDALRHKLLSVAEDGGMNDAAYSLKNLITDKKLRKATPGKDPQTGKMVTQVYEADGPTAVLISSTAAEIEPELKNRCLVLTLNEDKAQTETILALQRFAQTLEGKKEKKRREALRALHHNAQRLLRRVEVVNRFAPHLRFSAEQSRLRRDQMKYLMLMNALAFLHQYQRPLRHDGDAGEYVEVSLEDVALANRLCAEVLGRTLDELAPQTRRLLNLMTDLVKRIAKEKAVEFSQVRLTRWDIRKATRWGDTQLKVHLRRLVELEYLILHRGGRGLFEYELLYRGEGDDGGRFVLGLIDVDELRQKVNGHAYDFPRSAFSEERSRVAGHRSGSGRPLVGPRSGGGRDEETPVSPNEDKGDSEGNAPIPEKAHGEKAVSSYIPPHHKSEEAASSLVAEPLAAAMVAGGA
ncbi:MAG TPA: CHC2 zinc finger domain-containing protein [Fibrobacteria bacterium]|nr:CHC2 zinc finger domain-containing protein [Fibrobacteria bacterium]